MAELRPYVDELRKQVGLAVIGNGAPSFARGFREKMNVPDLLILSDEQRTSYKLAEWYPRTKLAGVAKSLARAAVVFWKHPQTSVQGDANQLGGAMVILPSGEASYRYRSTFAGDHPPMKLLRDEALKAAAAGLHSPG